MQLWLSYDVILVTVMNQSRDPFRKIMIRVPGDVFLYFVFFSLNSCGPYFDPLFSV